MLQQLLALLRKLRIINPGVIWGLPAPQTLSLPLSPPLSLVSRQADNALYCHDAFRVGGYWRRSRQSGPLSLCPLVLCMNAVVHIGLCALDRHRWWILDPNACAMSSPFKKRLSASLSLQPLCYHHIVIRCDDDNNKNLLCTRHQRSYSSAATDRPPLLHLSICPILLCSASA